MKEENINEIKYKRGRGRPRSYRLFKVVSEKEVLEDVKRGIINETVATRSWLRENNLGLSGQPKQKYTKRHIK